MILYYCIIIYCIKYINNNNKYYRDKVNHLYRQKEKLEDKIMEHYRKLESCTPKK